jgi:hypothetical protein
VIKIAKCAPDYQPKKTVQQNIQAHCMTKSTPRAQKLKKEVQQGEFRDFSSQQDLQQHRIAVPQECARA